MFNILKLYFTLLVNNISFHKIPNAVSIHRFIDSSCHSSLVLRSVPSYSCEVPFSNSYYIKMSTFTLIFVLTLDAVYDLIKT